MVHRGIAHHWCSLGNRNTQDVQQFSQVLPVNRTPTLSVRLDKVLCGKASAFSDSYFSCRVNNRSREDTCWANYLSVVLDNATNISALVDIILEQGEGCAVQIALKHVRVEDSVVLPLALTSNGERFCSCECCDIVVCGRPVLSGQLSEDHVVRTS